MRRLARELADEIAGAIALAQESGDIPALALPPIELRPPRQAEHGDFACNIALQLARPARRPPLEIARLISERLRETSRLAAVSAAPHGFLNFRLRDEFIQAEL